MLAGMTPDVLKSLKLSDATAQKLQKLGLHSLWDMALHLPLRYEDETHLMPIADAPMGVSCQVEGVVIHQEIQLQEFWQIG